LMIETNLKKEPLNTLARKDRMDWSQVPMASFR